MSWLWQSLYSAAMMFWETLWALVLGFSLSAFVQVFFRKEQISKHFGRAGLREVALATFLGAASSSCSYAAAATAKTFFKKGAALVPVLAFMFASTNLVFELGFLALAAARLGVRFGGSRGRIHFNCRDVVAGEIDFAERFGRNRAGAHRRRRRSRAVIRTIRHGSQKKNPSKKKSGAAKLGARGRRLFHGCGDAVEGNCHRLSHRRIFDGAGS